MTILSSSQSSTIIPPEAFSGNRTINVQFYSESNKKLGSQWEASRRLTNAGRFNQKFYSIIKTRTLPVDLKARVFTFTGAGIIARFYTGFTPVTLPPPEPVFSLRPDQPAFRDFDIYAVTAPTSLGTKWAADIFAEGNTSNQSKGSVGDSYGSGWIIEPNKEILLEIESLEAAQNISARLELYNGLLDLPL